MAPATTAQAGPGPGRRAVLASAAIGVPFAAGLLAGCSAATAPPGTGTRGAELRAGAARDSAALLERYDATAAAHPPLAPGLGPLREQVAQHLAVFAAAPGSPSASASARPRRVRIDADPGRAVADLADSERRLADARTAALAGAPPEEARLLASVAACGACHVLLLRGMTSGGAA